MGWDRMRAPAHVEQEASERRTNDGDIRSLLRPHYRATRADARPTRRSAPADARPTRRSPRRTHGLRGVRRHFGSRSPAGGVRAEGGMAEGPAVTSRAPRPAIIAPLSVHRQRGGMRSAIPAASARSVASSRTRALATTPPPRSSRGTPSSLQAATAFAARTSATASRKLAATSAGTGSPAAPHCSTRRATAVLSPENQKS